MSGFERRGIPKNPHPRQVYCGAVGRTRRYLAFKLPIAFEAARTVFVRVDPGHSTDQVLLNFYGGVTAALKRVVELQPAAEGRSFQVVIGGERTWHSQMLREARFGSAKRGSRGRSGSVNGTCAVDSQKAVPKTHKDAFPDLLAFHSVTATFPASPCPIREIGGKRERPPPFFLPGAGAGVLRNLHLRHTPWGGRSRLKYPDGKVRIDTRGVAEQSLMSARIGNLERSLYQAAKMLRSRRTYYCPHCGYQGRRSPCPRFGDKCEPIPVRRKKR